MGSAFIPNMRSVNLVTADRQRRARFVNGIGSIAIVQGGFRVPRSAVNTFGSVGLVQASTRELASKDQIWQTTVA